MKSLKKVMKIAIDGPAASGKSSVGVKLAKKLHFAFLDTGVMYRAVTYAAIKDDVEIENEDGVSELASRVKIEINEPTLSDGRVNDVFIDGEDVTWVIRDPEVNENVSQVSKYPEVRRILTDKQREIAKYRDIVMVGRDIGTIVLPGADLKIFLKASLEERARRRYEEEARRNNGADFESIIENLRKRDQLDSRREIAPLIPAGDAVIVNTDGKSVDEVVGEIYQYVIMNKQSRGE